MLKPKLLPPKIPLKSGPIPTKDAKPTSLITVSTKSEISKSKPLPPGAKLISSLPPKPGLTAKPPPAVSNEETYKKEVTPLKVKSTTPTMTPPTVASQASKEAQKIGLESKSDVKAAPHIPQVEIPRLLAQPLVDEQLAGAPIEVTLSQILSNTALKERATSYDVTAQISKRPDDTQVSMISTPQALATGIIDSIHLASSISQDLQKEQWKAMQQMQQLPRPSPPPPPAEESVTFSSKGIRPGAISLPPEPIDIYDRHPEPFLRRDMDKFSHSNQLSPEIAATRSTIPTHIEPSMRSMQVSSPSPSILPGIPPWQFGRCPTCGIDPHISIQSEYSRYRLPDASQIRYLRGMRSLDREGKKELLRVEDFDRRPTKFEPPFREPPPEPHVGRSRWRDIERDLNVHRARDSRARQKESRWREEHESTISSGPPTPGSYQPGPQYRAKAPGWRKEFMSDHEKRQLLRQEKVSRGSEGVRGGKSMSRFGSRQRNLFEGGLTTYRRSPYRSLSEMASYYTQLEVEDQADVISLLLACRKLEQQIEEQHVVIDMLDHDLTQAQQTLRFPPEWQQYRDIDIKGVQPPDISTLPDGNLPLYLRGRVLLQEKAPPPGATFIIEPDISRAIRTGDSPPRSEVAEKLSSLKPTKVKPAAASGEATKPASVRPARPGIPVSGKPEAKKEGSTSVKDKAAAAKEESIQGKVSAPPKTEQAKPRADVQTGAKGVKGTLGPPKGRGAGGPPPKK